MKTLIPCIAGFSLLLSAMPAVAQLPEAAQGLKRYHAAIRCLPGLIVRYRIDRERLEPAIKSGWGWEWCEVENGLRPDRTDKARLRFKGPDVATASADRMCIREKDLGLDGEMFVRLETSDEKGRNYPAVVAITSTKRVSPAELHVHFNYFRYLGYATAEKPNQNMSTRLVYPINDYWLPKAFDANPGKYSETGNKDHKGTSCRELQRKAWDEWLVEVSSVVRPRQRIFRWSEGGPIREVIEFEDFRPTGKGVELPWKIVYTSYAAPEDDPRFHNKPSRRLTLTVKEILTDPLPDSYFHPEIPAGSLVDDMVAGGGRPLSFIHKPDVDPFAKAVAAIEKERPARRFPWLLLLLMALVAGVGIAVLWQWRSRGLLSS